MPMIKEDLEKVNKTIKTYSIINRIAEKTMAMLIALVRSTETRTTETLN